VLGRALLPATDGRMLADTSVKGDGGCHWF
jgi:hypothetical protein